MKSIGVAAAIFWLTAAVMAAAFAGSALGLYTDSDPVSSNTFATASCFAGDTGALDPSTEAADTGGDGDGFELNPTNATGDGGGDASNINGDGDRHRFYDYGIPIPGGCSVVGIEVRLDWYLDSPSGNNSMDVELSWDGGSSWTTAQNDAVETTAEHTTVLGGPADTWGRAWTASELSNTNFRVRLTSLGHAARDFFLDWVPVNVYYGP